ncbi:MAG: hypothetical protein A2Y55_12390 [Actinobacteria bacterium RBG_16_68_12]|nr:MAG: hypothetical protein A2Y55_12390 [Actinobacteria bacterium RBG_16_68_12]
MGLMTRGLAVLLATVLFAALAFVLQPSAGAKSTGPVVASQRVTIAARPPVLAGNQATTLYGSVDSGRADEIVTIQARDCGQRSFTGVASATTRSGGAWTAEYWPRITTTLRAVWKGAASAPIMVRQHAFVALYHRSSTRFEVFLSGKWSFWHKRVLIQRRDGGSWATVKSVLLTETGAQPGYSQAWTSAEFKASVPKGTQVRAVLPLSQARPCYLAGVSKSVRT